MDSTETTIYAAVVIAAVLMVAMTALYAWGIIRSQRRYFEKAGREYKAEIALLDEQNRISMDLHDELGPALAMTKMQLNELKKATPEHAAVIEGMALQVEFAQNGLRRIAINLKPDTLRGGLQKMVADYIRQCMELYPMRINWRADVSSHMPTEVTLHLYRIVQEVVHNAIKHSSASQMELYLREERRKLYLRASDNGCGFETKLTTGKGLGLESIQSRTMLLGGVVRCYSSAEKGTTYFIEIPLKKWKQ